MASPLIAIPTPIPMHRRGQSGRENGGGWFRSRLLLRPFRATHTTPIILPSLFRKMSPSHQYNVTLIGTEGTGKTCFLAGLATLGLDAMGNSPFHIIPLADHAEAKQYLNDLKKSLQNGSWMPPTNLSTLIGFDLLLKRPKKSIRLQMLDYSGENFRDAFNELTPAAAQAFAEHLRESEVVLLLLDATDLVSIDNNEERRHALNEKIHAQLAAIWQEMGKETDISVLITKSDTIPLLKRAATKRDYGTRTAETFVKEHLGNLKEILEQVAQIAGVQDRKQIDPRKIIFFPVSAVGETDAETQRPMKGKLQPYGYEAVFQWVAGRKERKVMARVFSKTLLALVMVLVLIGIVVSSGIGHRVTTWKHENDYFAIMENPYFSVVEKLDQANDAVARWLVAETDKMRQCRADVIHEELVRQKERIANAPDHRRLEEIRAELVQLEKQGVGGAENELRIQRDRVDELLKDHLFKRVEDAFKTNNANLEQHANVFLIRYPTSPQATKVREMLEKRGSDQRNTAKSIIHDIAVSSPSQLQNKVMQIGTFLRDFESSLTPKEREEIHRAIELAKKFLENNDYTVRLKQYGGFVHPRSARLFVTAKGDRNNVHTATGSVTTATGNTFAVRWQSGEAIKVELETYIGPPSGWVLAASRELSGVDAITLLNGRQSLSPVKSGTGGWDWGISSRMAGGGYFIECEIQGISQEQWDAYKNYIKPGNGWRTEP